MALFSGRMALEIKRARAPFLWLVFLVIAFVCSIVIIFANIPMVRPFEDRYEVDAAFDTVKGVVPGQHEVKIAGVVVGIVSQTRVSPDGQGIARLSIKPQYAPIYKDAKLRIRPVTPLQDVYVSVESRGTPKAGKQKPGDPPIAAAQSISPVEISRVLNTFDTDARARLAIALDQAAIGLAGNGNDLKQAFVEIAPFLRAANKVTKVMAVRQTQIKRGVSNFGLFADELADRDRELNKLVIQGNQTLYTLARHRDPLARTLRELPPTMDVIRTTFADLRSAEAQLDPALRALRPTADTLETGLKGLEDFSVEATPAFQELQEPLQALRPLAHELFPTSQSLEGAIEKIQPQAPRLRSMIDDDILPCLQEMQNFWQRTLSVGKFSDETGMIPRADLSQNGTNVAGLTKDNLTTRLNICNERGFKPTTPVPPPEYKR